MWKLPPPTFLIIPALLLWSLTYCHGAPQQQRQQHRSNNVKASQEWCSEGVREGMLNVHLVSHSHDDVGWLKTVDQYYYGDRNDIQLAGVQYTLDSVITSLSQNPSRRFIYVEVGFFWRWWVEQDAPTRALVSRLVANNQLEFINGGWVMNDEASTHYNAIIDQMSLGLRWLNETFGITTVNVGWQIDPFGHSREMASLFAQFGFDGVFFGRLDYQDKRHRRQTHSMEFLWDASPDDLGPTASLLGSALFNGYNPPTGFCFDIFCNDSPINDNHRFADYNVDQKVADFISAATEWAAPYRTNNILMTMGSDFQYLAAHTWYKNLDKLIRYVNLATPTSKVHLLYSTPSCYLSQVNSANLTWTTKSDDFFPYASDPHAFWTGYFTSRPTLKFFTHYANNILQAAKHIVTAAVVFSKSTTKSQELLDKLWSLQEAVAVMQHHDAVAGTAKQHVTNDYSKRLAFGVDSAQEAIATAISSLDPLSVPTPSAISFCNQLNISVCPASENMDDFIVRAYNPLARPLPNKYFRIPVVVLTKEEGEEFTVTDTANGESLPVQLLPIPAAVLAIPGRRNSLATHSLVWRANKLLPLSLNNFRVTKTKSISHHHQQLPRLVKSSDDNSTSRGDFWVTNKKGLSVLFSGTTGLISALRTNTTQIECTANILYYSGMRGNNTKFEYRASGAYIFRPNGSEPTSLGLPSSYKVYEGPHVTEVHLQWGDWAAIVVSIQDHADSLQFTWTVGPIPVDDGVGKEVIIRWSTDLDTESVWYTDANGREILKRTRNSRPTWPYKVHEEVAGNYYPINSRLILRDETKGIQLAILNDRAQGGSSLSDGQAEIMVHRRLLDDDAFGVGEPLDETQFGEGLVAQGSFHLQLTTKKENLKDIPPTWSSSHRELAEELYMNTILLFHPSQDATTNQNEVNNDVVRRKTPSSTTLISRLPGVTNLAPLNHPGLHILTIEPLLVSTLLLRLENMYQRSEHPTTIVIPTSSLATSLNATSIRETLLGGNVYRDEATPKLTWNHAPHQPEQTTPSEIHLPPMTIRTFLIHTTQQ